MIIQCDCPSPYQDKEHGRGMRVHNETPKGGRCTICGKEKAVRKE